MHDQPLPAWGKPIFNLMRLCKYSCDLSPQPMVAVEGTTHIVRYFNAAFERLVGKPREELMGRPFAEAVPEGEANGCLALLDRVYRTRKPEILAEQEHSQASPSYWSYSVWAILGVDECADERPVGVMIQVTDATEVAIFRRQLTEMNGQLLLSGTRQHELTEAAENANRLKDEFLAMMSHELRTPLTAILGWANLIGNDELEPEDKQHGLQVIERSARAQAQLIEDLLDVSRISTGKLRLEVRPIGLTEVVEAAIGAVRPTADAKNIQLQVALDPQAGPVSGDAARLQQVVWNLLTNAIKFTPTGGRVVVRLERANTQWEIAVSDTGQGIDADFLPHVFDLFRQADQSSKRTHSGLGLGLSIVRQLVELHGGSVHAHSDGVGKGATFVVQLPVMATPQGMGHPDRPHQSAALTVAGGDAGFDCPPQLDGLRVLVVDDETDTRELLSVVLKRCGSEVRTAGSAAEALEIFDDWKPDVLISDIGMPETDGYALIDNVRALEMQQGGQLPAIALTAYAGVEDRIRVLRAGFQVHVPKPIELVEFLSVVASLAEHTGQ